MLADIQQAFARRDATEGRLRRFVADASHELSTPLTSIRGYAELFHRGLADRPDDLATAMGRIEAESVRMSRLVDDLLLLAKLDSGRPLETQPVDVVAVVNDAAGDLRVVAPDWPVTVEVPDNLLVLGDEDRLRQVVANLTSNAQRYTPPGTAITLRARADGDRGVIEVADQGPGLDEEQAAKVFERFYRVDAARCPRRRRFGPRPGHRRLPHRLDGGPGHRRHRARPRHHLPHQHPPRCPRDLLTRTWCPYLVAQQPDTDTKWRSACLPGAGPVRSGRPT